MPPRSPTGPTIKCRRALNVPLLLLAIALLTLALGGALGCGAQDDPTGASRMFGPETKSGLTVTALVTPYPPGPRSQAQFLITVTDEDGEPVTAAQVQLDMTMPAMPMPRNQPKAVEQAPGQYATQVVFTMAGEWEALVAVTTAQGEEVSVSFAMATK